MNKIISGLATLLCLLLLASCSRSYHAETFDNDPYNLEVYTLKNGLKVYFSVQQDEPRVRAQLVVKAGSKHDPNDATGMAHYLEHLMFKGTTRYGTVDFQREKPLLDKIEALYESLRETTDEEARKSIVKTIDGLSVEASRFSIPGEYASMVRSLGAMETNASTSYDRTVYYELIPANQLFTWLEIQAERFSDPVFRLFHSELEVVYEEKNGWLFNDVSKVNDSLFAGLFPHHPYGHNVVIGNQAHLRNPSIRLIREFYDRYYVANNMAIILVGDFDPVETIRRIDRLFGPMRSGVVPDVVTDGSGYIDGQVRKVVYGQAPPFIKMGWRLPAPNSQQADTLALLSMIMQNGRAGIMDTNTAANQLLRGVEVDASNLITHFSNIADYTYFSIQAAPSANMSLDDCEALIMIQIELLKAGQFPDWLLEACINNMKLNRENQLRQLATISRDVSNSFVQNIPWEQHLDYFNRIKGITKENIMDFANRWLGEDHVVVHKLHGQDPGILPLPKIHVSPVHLNSELRSEFADRIIGTYVDPIEAVFPAFDSIKVIQAGGLWPLYVQQIPDRSQFRLSFSHMTGSYQNPVLPLAVGMLDLLNTKNATASDLQKALFRIGCRYRIHIGNTETSVEISGLHENMEEAVTIVLDMILNGGIEKEGFNSYMHSVFDEREANKHKSFYLRWALTSYALYGPDNPFNHVPGNNELRQLSSASLTGMLRDLHKYPLHISYIGPAGADSICSFVEGIYPLDVTGSLRAKEVFFDQPETRSKDVLFVHFPQTQASIALISNGAVFDTELLPVINLYNTYFGGPTWSSIVFQEMREKRALAYSVQSVYMSPPETSGRFYNLSLINTQADKMFEALEAFDSLLLNMPRAESRFDLAREKIISELASKRTANTQLVSSFHRSKRLGLDRPEDTFMYEATHGLGFDDVLRFHEQHIAGQPYTLTVVGDMNRIDMKALSALGQVKIIPLHKLLGYE